jgi:hypothetical protein
LYFYLRLDFLLGDFLLGDFLLGDFLLGDFLLGDFLLGELRLGDFSGDLRGDLRGDFLLRDLSGDVPLHLRFLGHGLLSPPFDQRFLQAQNRAVSLSLAVSHL